MRTTLQKNIEKKLEERSLSASKLEIKAGLKKSAVRNILNGSSKQPTIFTLKAIAEALDCSILDLIEDNPCLSSSHSLYKKYTGYLEQKWDQRLFGEVFDHVKSIYELNKKHPTSAEVFQAIEEIYYYSLSKNKGLLDKKFSEWVIEKNSK